MRVRHERTVAAPPEAVWAVVGDPTQLPRWWPGVTRVEEVGERSWTTVLTSARGKAVRADQTLLAAEAPHAIEWRHEVAASPFERILKDSRTLVTLAAAEAFGEGVPARSASAARGGADTVSATRVAIEIHQIPRGWARLGAWQLRAATSRQIREALDGLAHAVPSSRQD